jgi:D-sedoheptulose 7-phosphate isomerase
VERAIAAGLDETRDVVQRIDQGQLCAATNLLLGAYDRSATVVTVGNGGSASTAAHFAADLGKYAVADATGFRAIDLVSNYAAHTAWTNDAGWNTTWESMIAPWIGDGDVLVAFSVHGGAGWSNNLVSALQSAKRRGAHTVGFSGAGGGRFAELCDVSLVVPTPKDPWITPLTEGTHVILTHLIVAALRERLASRAG